MEIMWRLIVIMMTTFKVGIFGKTQERALKAFEAFVDKINYDEIKYIKKSFVGGYAECVLFNGTQIIALPAVPHLGQKFDKILYDDEIHWNTVDNIVRPCLATPIWSFESVGLELK